jgi:hypothetical protein
MPMRFVLQHLAMCGTRALAIVQWMMRLGQGRVS